MLESGRALFRFANEEYAGTIARKHALLNQWPAEPRFQGSDFHFTTLSSSFFSRLVQSFGRCPPPQELPVSNSPAQSWPAGHFYSPIPSREDIEGGLAGKRSEALGIDFNEPAQRNFLTSLEETYPLLRFPETKTSGRRYFYRNGSFGALDAISLAAVGKQFRPKRIAEVGSGHSSAAMLDLRDDGILAGCEFTFIDPDFARFAELTLPGDLERVTLIKARVQDVPPDVFTALESGDILFIDSSHVSKIGSDVNHLIFHVLPILKPGVVIHIHDVFSGFEYPKEWFREGRSWNEQYIIRAFLMYNREFEVLALTSSLFDCFNDFFREKMPVTTLTGGGQLWLRRK